MDASHFVPTAEQTATGAKAFCLRSTELCFPQQVAELVVRENIFSQRSEQQVKGQVEQRQKATTIFPKTVTSRATGRSRTGFFLEDFLTLIQEASSVLVSCMRGETSPKKKQTTSSRPG